MTNCPNCGAPIKGPRCEYCGTYFNYNYDPHLQRINIIREDRPCDVLSANTIISKEFINYTTDKDTAEQVSKIAINTLSHKLAEALTNYMDLEIDYEPMAQAYMVRSKVRIVRPDYRFY